MVLLDGLDEISDARQRGEIVKVVKKFVDEYILSSDFHSAFDEKILDIRLFYLFKDIVETQPPSKSSGNQIAITSRLVGYHFHPLIGDEICHYTLSLMDHEEANEFVKKWRGLADTSIRDIFLSEEIELVKENMKTSSKRILSFGEAIFENSSELLKSNPSLLSLICTAIFRSFGEFDLKSRVQVYNYTVQAALYAWKMQEPSLSESILNNFLINLATYLHLHSSSGLIDGRDLEHLCCSSLQQLKISNNRAKLREIANKIISLLESNATIAAEKGLQVFGFLHLSFQEYFVAQSLVRGSDIEKVAKRILSFTVNSRFRESLLLAVGWISWKYPFDQYDKFCSFLFTPTENQSIPFGILLFFDAINDMYKLPSNAVIFTALNNLLNHPSNEIRNAYLILNLSKLPENITIEWMQLHLQDEKYLRKFCQSFPIEEKRSFDRTGDIRKLVPSVVYQQLWSFHHRNSSAEFIVDQTLRRTLISDDDIPDQIFNKDFSNYFLSHNICASNVHPLILSGIIEICGGIYFIKDESDALKIDFSLKQMHRESSVLAPIIEYFDNNEKSHLTKVNALIEKYDAILQKFSSFDTSVDIVDTFVALICLQGLSHPSIYEKYNEYQALPLALDRLQRTWFYLKELCAPFRRASNYPEPPDVSFMISEIETIMNVFSSQPNQFEEQCTSFSVACETAWKRLGMWNMLKESNIDISHNNKISRYFQCQQEFTDIISEEKLNRIINDIYSLQMLQMDLVFLSNFLPQPIQQLYHCTTIFSSNNAHSLPLVVFLTQCLTYFEHIHMDYLNPCLTLSILQPLFKEYSLENYALVLFWENYYGNEVLVNDHEGCSAEMSDRKEVYKAMKDRKSLDSSFIYRPEDWEMFIIEECQRIDILKNELQNADKDVRLFGASISLARLFQAKYSSEKYRTRRNIIVIPTGSDEIYSVMTNILDPVLRIIAFSIIIDMEDPLIFDLEQRNQLRAEMISQLQFLLPHLSLLKSTFLFIQCHTARRVFPVPFQHMAVVIGNKLIETTTDKQCQEQEAAFVALRYLDNSDLSYYLLKFAKRMENLSNLLRFNSTAFHRYFINIASFDSSNSIFLSIMYLVELAFDAQILITTQKSKTSSMTEVKELWNDSSKYEKIMTLQVALWITNYLNMSNGQAIHQIIEDISHCCMIERQALPIIEKWLDYRTTKGLEFFAYYAALTQLTVVGSSMSHLIHIIEEMFLVDVKFCLKSTVECLLTSPSVNLTILHQILVRLHRNGRYFSKISVRINRKEVLELILSLELKRITANVHQTHEITTKSFLSLIKDCSEDLQAYLAEYLHEFIHTDNKIEDHIKEEYLAIVIKWIVDVLIGSKSIENLSMELYNYIFVLLHDERFSSAQKAVINAPYSLFFHQGIEKENIFLEDNAIIKLEKMICSWDRCAEDVVAVCLLAYGNCLRRLHRFHTYRNVSNEMTDALTNLCEKSSSEIVSIRANFCLIFTQFSNNTWHTQPNWLENESNMVHERRYRILVQQTLYKVNERSFMKYETVNDMPEPENDCEFRYESMNEIVEHIEKYFDELIDTFITEFYNYLCDNDTSINLCDLVSNYIEIARRLIERKSNKFVNAIQKSYFGEEHFKTKLCVYRGNNSTEIEGLIQLYLVFGTVSVDFIDRLERVEDETVIFLLNLNLDKLVSDPVAIEKLLRLINLTSSKSKLDILLCILTCLTKADAVSLLDVHEKVSLISNVLYDESEKWYNGKDFIIQQLLNLSCFQKYVSLRPELKLFTPTDIDEALRATSKELVQTLLYK